MTAMCLTALLLYCQPVLPPDEMDELGQWKTDQAMAAANRGSGGHCTVLVLPDCTDKTIFLFALYCLPVQMRWMSLNSGRRIRPWQQRTAAAGSRPVGTLVMMVTSWILLTYLCATSMRQRGSAALGRSAATYTGTCAR